MRLDDGFSTTISFSENPTVLFYEKNITPPGMDGGGSNDTTTMRNVRLRTKAPKKLKTMTDMTATVSYDPQVFDAAEVWAMINVNQTVTITFPDGETLAFWGYLDKFMPAQIEEGSQPTATITVVCTNQDNDRVEQDPEFTDS